MIKPVKRQHVATEVVGVTPAMAQEWLRLNTHNRPLSMARAKGMAADMAAGRWSVTNETIGFDTEGRLLDGQHRLQAVVLAGVPVKMGITFGLQPEVFTKINIGSTRTPGDILSIEGVKRGKTVSASLKLLALYTGAAMIPTHINGGNSGSARKMSNEAVLALFRKHPQMERSVEIAASCWSVLPMASGGFCHYVFSQKDPEGADLFFSYLSNGAGLNENSPVLMLRNKLIDLGRRFSRTRQAGTGGTLECLAFTFKAWNAYRKNKPLKVFRFAADEPFPRAE